MEVLNEGNLHNGFNTEKHYILFIIAGISIFILGETTRSIFSASKANQINFIFAIVAAVLLAKYIYYLRAEMNYVYMLLSFTGVTLLNDYFHGKNMNYYALMITTLIIPLFFSTLRLDKKTAFKLFDKFLFVFNILCIVLLISGVADYITNGQVQYLLARYLIKGEFSDLIMLQRESGTYRFYSFIGHPLSNSKYFLIFFSLNNIYSKFYGSKINKYLVTFVSILGITLSGSKSAMVIGLFLIIFCSELKKYKWVYYLISAVISVSIYYSPLFQDNLMQRYIDGYKSGDISTGRNELLLKWVKSDIKKPRLIIGGGGGYSREISKSFDYGINFEYPLIMLAYDYSILGVIIIYAVIFINPIISFIKSKNFFILANFIAISIFVNGNNGIANFSDDMAKLCFIIMLYKNIYSPEVKEEKIDCVQGEHCNSILQ